ncbi:molybdenum cofactor synthesis domain protein, partial [Vibrio parahaemolyticus 10296]
CGVGA